MRKKEVQAVTDRSYRGARASKHTLAMADEMFEVVRALDPDLELKYNKFYIGLAKGGAAEQLCHLPSEEGLAATGSAPGPLERHAGGARWFRSRYHGLRLSMGAVQNSSREGRYHEAQRLSGGSDDEGVRRGCINS